eukprot:95966_1
MNKNKLKEEDYPLLECVVETLLETKLNYITQRRIQLKNDGHEPTDINNYIGGSDKIYKQYAAACTKLGIEVVRIKKVQAKTIKKLMRRVPQRNCFTRGHLDYIENEMIKTDVLKQVLETAKTKISYRKHESVNTTQSQQPQHIPYNMEHLANFDIPPISIEHKMKDTSTLLLNIGSSPRSAKQPATSNKSNNSIKSHYSTSNRHKLLQNGSIIELSDQYCVAVTTTDTLICQIDDALHSVNSIEIEFL